jgi:hypothetical protein
VDNGCGPAAFFFYDPGIFLVSRMMFYDFNDGYTLGCDEFPFFSFFLRTSFTFRLDVGCAPLHREKGK